MAAEDEHEAAVRDGLLVAPGRIRSNFRSTGPCVRTGAP